MCTSENKNSPGKQQMQPEQVLEAQPWGIMREKAFQAERGWEPKAKALSPAVCREARLCK